MKTRAESKRSQFNYFPIKIQITEKSDQHLITTKSRGYVLTNTQIINWSYVLVTSIFILHCEMTFICKDLAYGAENPALIFIFIALLIRTNSLGYISCVRQKLTD